MTAFLLCLCGAVCVFVLYEKRLLSQFALNAVLGLVCCVAAVCLAPTLGLRFSFNLFTAGISLFLGPAGVAGLFSVMWIWDM